MTLRHQPPAWSPVSPGTIARGLRARRDPAVLERLRTDLASRYGASGVLLTGSGTLALTLAMRAAGGDPSGPVVALPAWGCYDLASAADGAEARVRLYDLDPRTLGPDAESLRRALAAGVDAVVFAHFFGVPVRVAEFAGDLRSGGVTVIDDAAQGAGGSIDGRPLGAGGDWGVLSFGRGKGRTGGRGGALLAFGEERADQADRVSLGLPTSGGVRAAAGLGAVWLFGRPSLYWLPAALPWLRLGETIYHPPPDPDPLSRLAAAVLLVGAAEVATENARRRDTAAWWTGALDGVSGIERVAPTAGAEPGWLRYPVVVDPELVTAFSSAAFRRLGVMPGYPMPLAALTRFRHRIQNGDDGWPGADLLARRLFTLPTHGRLKPHDRDRLMAAIRALTAS